MSCNLSRRAGIREAIDLDRYWRLHDDGRNLIREWYEHADGGARGEKGDSFESFIYLWIAFNAWAACVTGEERDTAWRDALVEDRTLCTRFDELAAGDSQLAAAAGRFRALWPIFKVEELRRLEVDYWLGDDLQRSERAARFQDAGARQFEPRCWAEHHASEEKPLDWAHTLAALYRVRCNLFHGDKMRNSENDRHVVDMAYATLFTFVTEGDLIA